jgi:putative DNA primase/helicase
VGDLRDCAELLSGQKVEADIDDSLAMRLLADIRSVWPQGQDKLFTPDLLAALGELDDSPWKEEIRLAPRKLARMLRPFRIESTTVRIGEQTGKGYKLEAFESAFSRYLHVETSHASQPA